MECELAIQFKATLVVCFALIVFLHISHRLLQSFHQVVAQTELFGHVHQDGL